jgi:predicted HicB family RNase H-like nuclease
MKDIMVYKNYMATIHYSNEDEVFFGQIEGINDLISFEGQSVAEMKAAFIDAVEDYLDSCRQNEKTPEKAYKGSFNIRISPELHKQAARQALIEKISLNQFIEKAVIERVKHPSHQSASKSAKPGTTLR